MDKCRSGRETQQSEIRNNKTIYISSHNDTKTNVKGLLKTQTRRKVNKYPIITGEEKT